jgi:hypothetical protein
MLKGKGRGGEATWAGWGESCCKRADGMWPVPCAKSFAAGGLSVRRCVSVCFCVSAHTHTHTYMCVMCLSMYACVACMCVCVCVQVQIHACACVMCISVHT